MIYSLIIRNNIVINKTIGNELLTTYPFPYDLIIQDVNENVLIDSTYNPVNGTFTLIGAPYNNENGN
jgi:hypothetical protein